MSLRGVKKSSDELTQPIEISVAVFRERLSNISSDVCDLKGSLEGCIVEQRQREDNRVKAEKERDEKIILIGNSVDKAHERLDKFSEWKDDVESLIPSLKIMAKLSAALLVPAIVYFLSVFGQWALAKAQGVIP